MSFLQNLSIYTRLLLGFFVVTLMVVIVGLIGINSARTSNQRLNDFINQTSPKYVTLLQIQELALEINSATLNIKTEATSQKLQQNTVAINDEENNPLVIQKNELLADIQSLSEAIDQYQKYVPKGEKQGERFVSELKNIQKNLTVISLEIFDLKGQSGQSTQSNQKENDLVKEEGVLKDLITKEINSEVAKAETLQVSINSSYEKAMKELIGISILIFIFSIGIGFLISRSVAKPIKKLKDAAVSIASGNFDKTIDITSKDEIGQLASTFNDMSGKLKASYQGLEEQVAQQTQQLQSQLEALTKSNSELEGNKKIMTGLLEDSRRLEEQLKLEKASVEKKIEERTHELNEEKVKLQASIESLRVGFIMTDAKNNVIITNVAAQRLLELAFHTGLVTLTTIGEKMKGIDLVGVVTKCIVDKSPVFLKELEYQDHFLKLFITPIIDNNSAIGSVILIDDITDEKNLALSRDEFFSIASHELRTPLTAIRGNTAIIQEYYKEAIKDPSLSEMIDDIHESSMRLLNIVRDFLDTSRLELGKLELKKEEIDLFSLGTNIIKEYQTTVATKKLYLKIEQPLSVLPPVVGDIERVKQVIINLFGNSLKFTEVGGITITFEQDGNFVKTIVSDTGRGIPAESQALLFRKFQQAGGSLFTRDASHGTGLGLYISKMLVEAMGGKIKFEHSEIGKGTIFSMSLPIKPVASTPQ